MLIKKNKIIIINNNNNIISKQFIGTMKLNDPHRKGPRNCVCGKPIDILFDNEVNILKKLEKYDNFPKLVNYDDEKRKEMGLNARKRAIAFFDEKIIINQYKNAINKVVKNS